MSSVKVIKATLTLVAFVLTLGAFVFSADVNKEKKKDASLKLLPLPINQEKKTLEGPDYLRWKAEYDKSKADFIKWGKSAQIGAIASICGYLATGLFGVLSSSAVPTVISGVVAVGASGYWIYAGSKKSSAKEKMDLLMDEGRIKKFITASINPAKKHYAITFAIAF
jgi:hypothetical protein